MNASHTIWNFLHNNGYGFNIRNCADQIYAQILAPLESTSTYSNNITDFAITRNFAYPWTVNDLDSDLFPVKLSYELGNFDLGVTLALSTGRTHFNQLLS